MGCGGHPEDTDSELDEAGPASAGGAGSRCAVAPPDPSAAPAFAQVRALLWRREWMQSQIALLSQRIQEQNDALEGLWEFVWELQRGQP